MSETNDNIFLSCASAEEDGFIENLGRSLAEKGYTLDRDGGPRGVDRDRRSRIESASRVLAIVSPRALESRPVRAEWEHALLFGRNLILVLRDTEGLPADFARLVYVDFASTRPFEEAFAQLLSVLQDEPLPFGPLHGVPSIPIFFHPRREELVALSQKVMGAVRKPNELTSPRDPVAVTGPLGVGKSVLVSALARSADGRRAFFDGIVWLDFDLGSDLAKKCEQVGAAFGDDPLGYADLEVGRARLAEILVSKACLIVLDDVRESAPIESFLNLLGANCRVLFTTSEPSLVSQLGFLRAQPFPLAPVASDRAIQLLARWAGDEDPPSAEASALVAACGGLPYSLALAGGMVREGAGMSEVASALTKLAPAEPGRTLKLALEVLAQQDAEAARRFSELVVFTETEPPPESVVTMLWGEGKAAGASAEGLLSRLEALSLIRLDGERPRRRVSLHPVQSEHLRTSTENKAALHARLLTAYRGACRTGWASGPNDGYFFQHLLHHLNEAGAAAEGAKLLSDFSWLSQRLRATDVRALLSDFEVLDAPVGQSIAAALRLSAHVLWRDPDQLASQLCGRLMKVTAPEARQLLRASQELTRGAWLRPITPALTPPGGPLLRSLTGHVGWVTSVAVTPDGEKVLSASSDQTLKLWSLENGSELQTLTGHSGWVTSIVVTADGRRAVTALVDQSLKVWSLETGLELMTLDGHEDWVTSVAVTPDGKRAVSASWDQTLKVWDLEDGREVMTLSEHGGGVTAVCLSPDGRLAVSSSNDMTLKVWDLETGTAVRTLQGHKGWALAVAMLPGGRRAVSASSDLTLKLWDLDSGVEVKTLAGHTREVTSVAVTPDGRRAVSGSADLTIRVWDLESGREVRTLTGHYGGVNAVAVTADGRRAVSASDDETVKLWDLEGDPELQATMAHNGGIHATVVTRDGGRVVSASWDRTLKIWDLATGHELGVLAGHSGEVTAVAPSSDGRHLVSASRDRTLRLWSLAKGKTLKVVPSENVVLSLAVTGGGRRVITASADERIRIWDLERGQVVQTLLGHADAVLSVAATTGGRYVVSASRDGTLKIWDLEKAVAIRTLKGHEDWVVSVALTADSRRAVSASSDGTIKVWNLLTIDEPLTLRGHDREVTAVAVTPDGKRVVSVSRDETLKIWDVEGGRCLATFYAEGEFSTCATSPDGRIAVAGDHLGRLYFLRLEGA